MASSRRLRSSSHSSSSISASLASTASKPEHPTQKEVKLLFKKLCRRYQKRQTPLADHEMEPLWMLRDHLNFEDFITWRDQVGVKKGVVYEDGKVLFNEWPVPPHEQIVSEINSQFSRQFSTPFSGTPHYPVFVGDGTTGICLLSRMNLTS
jgi:hypothetical protein